MPGRPVTLPTLRPTPALAGRAAALLPALCAALLATACATRDAPHAQTPRLSYPETPRVDHIDRYHGVAVADPYRWLEDDRSADTAAWVKAQNAVTEAWLAAMPQRAPTRALFTRLYNHERHGLPFQEGTRWFWTRNDGLQPQSVLYTADAPDGAPQVALDPNALSADGTVALSAAVPSRDGRLLAYGTARAGSDWQTWRVRDLATGADLPDTLQWVKFSRAEWTADGRGFFYARYDEPSAAGALSGVNAFHKLYYHRLGTAQADDVLVAANPAQRQWMFGATVSDDGRLLIVTVRRGAADRNALMVLPLPGGSHAGGTPQPLLMDFDALYLPLHLQGRRLVLHTTQGAPNGRLVSVDVDDPAPARWLTLVPEAPQALVGASAVGGRYLLRYLQDAATVVRVHAADGALLRELPLPGVGSAGGFGGRWQQRQTFFSFTSLVTPADVLRWDADSDRVSLFRRPRTAFDPEQFETRRAFVTSRDGTRLPVFIAHRKGLPADGRAPTLLTGYGGFNQTVTPAYSVTAVTWMQMGGVWVSASLRGGGEYGRAWHEAGTKLKKQNVFDDFIAAAEWLVTQRITTPSRLAIYGGSNGGLLVGAVVNQRPDLFGAAVPAVGVMDMLRFHRFTIGPAWVGDYGSSDDPAQFAALHAYSPLHNIRGGRDYPAVLVTTGDHDDRVVPAHSFKYAATLQAADTGPAPKLIRIETDAGHGAGKPTDKLIAERADILAFIAHRFGMTPP